MPGWAVGMDGEALGDARGGHLPKRARWSPGGRPAKMPRWGPGALIIPGRARRWPACGGSSGCWGLQSFLLSSKDYVAIPDGGHSDECTGRFRWGSPHRTPPSMPHARGWLRLVDFIGFASTPMPGRLLRSRLPRDRAGRSIHRLWLVKEQVCGKQIMSLSARC